MHKQLIRISTFILTAFLLLTLAGCGTQEKTNNLAVQAEKVETRHLKIGATVTPHAEILYKSKELLHKEGVEIEVVEFTDYTRLNEALEDGDLDANYFQHSLYLNDFNAKNNTEIVSAGKVHYEPFGLYGGRAASLDEVKEGSTIAVPNDATNEARALLLLEEAGLIKLNAAAGITATVFDIEENEYNLEIVELGAEQVARALKDVDFAVINGNYAISADLNPSKDALLIESSDTKAADAYANVIAVKKGAAQDEAIKKLLNVLHSEEIKTFINEKYEGAVLPVAN